MPCPTRISGFTLIELLITISISALLMISGTLFLTDSRKNQTIKKAQQQIKIGLEQAKNDAFYGKKPGGCTTGSYKGNEFYFDTVNNKYVISALCSSAIVTETKNFGEDVVLDSASEAKIIFKTVTGAVTKPDGTPLPVSGAIYNIKLGTLSKTITVSTSGGINVSD